MEDIEIIAKQVSKRIQKFITANDIKKCVSKEDVHIIEDFLNNNYCLVKPSCWRVRSKNMSRTDLLLFYDSDMKKLEDLNYPIFELKEKFTLRFATYNVHFWADIYAKQNLSGILKTIKQLNADVVCVQEAILPFYEQDKNYKKLSLLGYEDKIQYISNTSIDKIYGNDRNINTTDRWKKEDFIGEIKNAGFDYIASSAASTTHSGYRSFFGNAIFSTKDMPIASAFGVTLKAFGQGRSATIAEYKNFYIKGVSYKGLIAMSLHLDVFDDTGNAREEQINQLLEYIEQNYTFETPIVILGDLNSLHRTDYTDLEIEWLRNNNLNFPLDFQVLRNLKKAGFKDVFEDKGLKSSTWSARRVDYILTRSIPEASISKTYAFYSDQSDHIPLLVDIKIDSIDEKN